MDEALELRCQHQEHHQHGHGEGQQHGAAGLLVIARLAAVVDLRPRRQHLAGNVLQCAQGFPEGVARHQSGADGDRADAVEAFQLTRIGQFLERDQIGQRHQLATAIRAHVEIAEIAWSGAVFAAGLKHHIVFLAVAFEGGDPARAEHGFQRAADFRHRHAEVGRALMVDHDPQLGAGFLVVAVDADQAGNLLGALEHARLPARQRGVIGSTDDELHGLAATA